MALTGPVRYVNTFVVASADVVEGSFEEKQLNAGILPPIKFSGETIPLASATVAAVTAAAATTEATGWALANANKVAINAILTSLKTAKLMA